MQYLAHRGFWLTPDEKNSETAFRRAFEAGYGIETDVRDYDGQLVISHDPPSRQAMGFDRFLQICLSYPAHGKLALNVKADGLQNALKTALDHAGVTNYVTFDMSIPDLLGYRRAGLPFYVRRSEFEGASPLDAEAAGAWLDAFVAPYADATLVRATAAAVNGDIALVSPELHNRPYAEAWEIWRDLEAECAKPFTLCTDFPDRAQAFFSAKGGDTR
jgi:glycerophosphoryl diester phosphodiesterase